MSTSDADVDLAERDRIIRSTVTLLITAGTAALTPGAICAAACVTEASYTRSFNSVESVYTAIVASLLDDHVDNNDGAVQPRLSLVESLRIAMRSVWELTKARIDVHHALYVVTTGQAVNPDLTEKMGFSIHQTHLEVAQAWLQNTEVTCGVTRQLPVGQLAVFVQATLNGVIQDFLARQQHRCPSGPGPFRGAAGPARRLTATPRTLGPAHTDPRAHRAEPTGEPWKSWDSVR